jgi:hypothetical protein
MTDFRRQEFWNLEVEIRYLSASDIGFQIWKYGFFPDIKPLRPALQALYHKPFSIRSETYSLTSSCIFLPL